MELDRSSSTPATPCDPPQAATLRLHVLQALRCEAAAESDFGVATASGRASPSPEEWKQLFANA